VSEFYLFGLFVIAAAASVSVLARCIIRRNSFLLVTALVVMSLVNASLAWCEWQNARIDWAVAGAIAECAGAPKVVPFHNGMTLCPGQTAIITIEIPPSGREL
jgi:hypothetical protein